AATRVCSASLPDSQSPPRRAVTGRPPGVPESRKGGSVKVLVCPCSLQLGGSEINAVDLAAAVQQRGHEAVVFGRPGPLGDRARDMGLRVVSAHTSLRLRPSPLAARELREVVRRERPDIVHAYEGYTCTEAFYAVGLRPRTALVGTLYTMSVDPSSRGRSRRSPARPRWRPSCGWTGPRPRCSGSTLPSMSGRTPRIRPTGCGSAPRTASRPGSPSWRSCRGWISG